MSNWFENHPIRSIIGHTLLVAAATATAYVFLFDSNKVSAAKAETDQYKAKTETLESEISSLRDENGKYLEWLSSTPSTIPYLEKKVADLTQDNQELRSSSGEKQIVPNISTPSGRGATISIGQTFVDDLTGFTFGLLNVNKDFTADVLLVFPRGEKRVLKTVKTGERWGFTFKSVPYHVQLRHVDWYSNKATVAIKEATG